MIGQEPARMLDALKSLQEHPSLVMTGRSPSGDVIQIATLGPGYEVQIVPTSGQIKHRCFVSDDLLLAWFALTYVLPGENVR